ncbi:MAG TPA: hypothetical protein DER01_20415 [Phycisphaerales bacterium]|nr:hypothetical protein [Phycisphaerales bacterium]|tara:strand:+ start:468 stop:1205 length:738 start_codon:yes stop_codon:yes gene_type:complete
MQQEANELLAIHEYNLILLDLKILSCPSGERSPDYWGNLFKHIRARMQRRVPVILMTGQHQQCVDLMVELSELGVDGSISMPFPTTGRTLLYVMRDVLRKFRRQRLLSEPIITGQMKPFTGGVLAVYPTRFELCDATIALAGEKGYAWSILNILKEKNAQDRFVCISSDVLANRLGPQVSQPSAVQSVRTLRRRIQRIMRDRLSLNCGMHDVIVNDRIGYHLLDWITVECRDDYSEDLLFVLQTT